MKKLIYGIAVLALFSCESDVLNSQLENSPKIESTNTDDALARKVIFQASWDEWGRTSKQCNGWGLCNFHSCWFCESTGKYSGKVEVDSVTKEGYLFVVLDPNDLVQNDAIIGNSVFYVDNDIDNSIATLHQGAYNFDSSIGEFGGYKIAITVK
ncbi:hypothetical protein [Frigoriflavimonas asaccharolytica]|uniref:Lipoprotein n=1 Tax=Frigoriflavimonas asaccharolytica TaxID=2735899 RepID=A0A8J8K6N5_9FLAO|nr:hypothetical protein [Frigoriflavimonas asaccharolytica]NRS93945.1 hypothetical protein [Frigoriflavimonas asaccharolytica]